MDEQQLHHPLLPLANPFSPAAFTSTTTNNARASTTTTDFVDSTPNDNIISSTSCIALRLLMIILIGVISTWANNEASKGFSITVTNDMKNTPVGDKFSLFYVSNDEATRLVQTAFSFATKVLYPNALSMPEKLIDQIDVRLASYNSSGDHIAVTKSCGQESKYVLSISPLIMESGDFRYRVRKNIQRGMTEVLLFDRRNRAPKTLLNGMVEYISNSAGYGGPKPVFRSRNYSGKCWEDKDPKVVAQFLGYCEERSEGFIGKLNQAISRDDRDEDMVEKALGMVATPLCESFHNSLVESQDLISVSSFSIYR